MSLALPASITTLQPSLRRIILRTLGIAGADVASQVVRILLVAWPISGTDAARLVFDIARESAILGVLLALALESREGEATMPSSQRSGLFWLLAIAAIGVSSALADGSGVALELGLVASEASLRLHTIWNNLVVGLVAVAYLTRRRDAIQVEHTRALQEARLVEARRRLAAVGAQASRSRLDPQMLFDAMIRSRDVYMQDLGLGDVLLDRLTTCLRVALAGSADGACTLAREAAIAVARVDLERSESELPLVVTIADEIENFPFPPGVLSRLTHDWLAAADGTTRAMEMRADAEAGAPRLVVSGPCPVPALALRACQRALSADSLSPALVRADGSTLLMEFTNAPR